MDTKILPRLTFLLALSCVLFSLSCKRVSVQDDTFAAFNPAFAPFISGYTVGEISRTQPVKISFTKALVSQEEVGKEAGDWLSLTPSVEGTLSWTSQRTIEFTPDSPLKSGILYQAQLKTKAFKDTFPQIPSPFAFQFKTLPQGLNVELAGLKNIDLKNFEWNQLSGRISSRDFESNEVIEAIFAAEMGSNPFKITWEHEEDNYVHSFVVDSIPRTKETKFLEVEWDGSPKNVSVEGKQQVQVTKMGSFQHVGTLVYNHPEQYVQLEFSDPIDNKQRLEGMVYIPGVPVSLSVTSNLLRIYPKSQLSGSHKLHIDAGIENLAGTPLQEGEQIEVQFEDPKPDVRITGKGVIIPQGETLPFVFETIGLSAVDVRIIKIYENNILQFLQGNDLDGKTEINRVGQVVTRSSLPLNNLNGRGSIWTQHILDLSNIVSPEPGAIYEVALGFKPQDVLYKCSEELEGEDTIDMLRVGEAFNSYYWYEDDYYYYDWDQRDNPCNRAFYRKERVVKRNVLASNLGLVAKQGDAGNMFLVTDLLTTQPVANASLELYDFQQQLIGSARTDSEGKASIATDKTPFVLVANSGSQKGYLRLDDGYSLSMSRFDVGGSTYQEGIKGYLYGERGVWRPGDDIFLTFILEDKSGNLPEEHPVNFELRDPKGKLVVQQVKTRGEGGFYTFPVSTDADAPTGNYRALVSVGGAEFYKTVKVETITPNRLKIQMDMGPQTFAPGSARTGVLLQANWLHGAAANNLTAKVTANLRANPGSFPGFDDFTFWDPIRRYEGEETVIFDAKLNSAGQATVPTDFSMDRVAPGRLKAFIRTQVFEPGGNISSDNFTMDYHPYQVYVGIKAPQTSSWSDVLSLNESHRIDIATVNSEGEKVDRQGLKLKVYKLDWKWWWDRSYSDLANYQGKMYTQPVQEVTLRTTNGEVSWDLQINEPEWGRYLIRIEDPGGHISGSTVYVDYPGWGGRARKGSSDGAQMLSFTADQASYQVGQKVTLNIPSGYAGRALVSLEKGAEVLEAFWVDAKQGETQFTFPTTAEMVPNIYAHVTLLQPHAQTANDLPMRMYGVLPLFVEDPQTQLEPTIDMANQLKPNSSFDIQVGEADGKAMTYTLAVIDEGLLDITRFKTPDPHAVFYQREALNVKTWDMFDHVVGAYGGEIKSLLSIGGDGMATEDPDKSKQNRFRPVVKFLGPFTLKKGRTNSHTIDMPNYVGSVRTMVVAGQEGAYGFAEKATPVKQPLMVLGSLPRVLSPGESLQLPATVFAMEDNISQVSVQVETNDLLTVSGGSTQQLNFSQTGDQLASFSLQVKPYLGTGHIKLTARSGSHSAVYETDIEVRMPNPPVTKVIAKTLSPGETWKQVYNPLGIEGSNQATVEVSAIPPINLKERLRYLIRYPYGCIEQTTSSVFPQLYLSRLTELKGQQSEEIAYNIREGIKRLQRFQTPQGGFVYWPGGKVNEWGTNYAGHFLLEAEKAGYSLPLSCISQWKSYQQSAADSWTEDSRYEWSARSSQLTQAYRLYLLALSGAPNVGAMNRLRKIKDLYTPAKWHLISAYYLAGQKRVADRMGKDLPVEIPSYTEQSYTYGSGLRDRAIMVSALSQMNNREKALPITELISDRLSSSEWLSTQTTAYCLVAMAHFIGVEQSSPSLNFSYSLAGKGNQSIQSKSPIWQESLPGEQSSTLQIENTTGQVLYARIIQEGTPLQGDQTEEARGMSMNISYQTPKGKTLNPTRIEQGTEFLAIVTLSNTGRRGTYREMALNQMFPSGWEIINTRMYDQQGGGDRPTYQDIRDDRVYTFFDLPQGKSKTFHIRLTANYLGRYYLPSVYSEAMYDKSISARTGGKWVEVIRPSDG